MGREKIELAWDRSTVLEAVLDKIDALRARPVVVVLREDLSDAASRARRHGAVVVVNPRPEHGMIESVRLGVAAISERVDAVLLWPADHPAVTGMTLQALAIAADRTRAVLPRFGGRRGHPAMIGADLLAGIESIPPGEGLHYLWRARPEIIIELDVDDPGILVDLDTSADYEKWKPQ
jgi:molybdenum cofactor cytidylyltransferase